MLLKSNIVVLLLVFLMIAESQSKVYGQNYLFDSLNSSISGLSDDNKIIKLREAALLFEETSLDRAIFFAEQRALLAESKNSDSLVADNLNLLGNIYLSSGLNDRARNKYIESLAIFKTLNDYNGCATETHNLGLLYYTENDTIKSLDYFKQSIDYREKTNNNRRIGDGYTTIGEIYLNFGFFTQSITALSSAIEFYRDELSYPRLYDCQAFLADNFLKVDPEKALRWINEMEATYILDTTHIYIVKQRISLRLGQYYLKRGDLSNAIHHFKLSKPKGFSFENEYFPSGIFTELAFGLAEEGNLKQSLYYSELARIISKNNYNTLRDKTISIYKTRLNLRKTDEEIARTLELNSIIVQRLRTEKIINISMLLVMLVLITILISLVYNLYRIKRSRKALALRNSELRKAYNKNLNFKETTLDIKQSKNIFFNIISNNLAEPFADLNDKLDKLAEGDELSFSKPVFLKRLNGAYELATKLEKSLKRILLWSKLQRNKYEIQSEEFVVHDYIHELLPEFLGMSIKMNIKIIFDIDSELKITYDKKSLKSILKVLIENSIDNAAKGSDIIIRAKQTGKEAIISITDFGKGIPLKYQKAIFDINRVGNKLQSKSSKNRLGLGLLLSKRLAELNNSSITFESKEKKGTTFYIQIKN